MIIGCHHCLIRYIHSITLLDILTNSDIVNEEDIACRAHQYHIYIATLLSKIFCSIEMYCLLSSLISLCYGYFLISQSLTNKRIVHQHHVYHIVFSAINSNVYIDSTTISGKRYLWR